MGRRAVARGVDVVRHGNHELHRTHIASANCSNDACSQSVVAGLSHHQFLGGFGLGTAQRHVEHISTMLNGELHRGDPRRLFANAVVSEGFQDHDGGIGSHAGLCPASTCSANDACHLGAVAVNIIRIVVVVIEIVAVVGVFATAIPKPTGQVLMVEAHTRIDDGDEHALAREAQVPYGRHVDLVQKLGNVAVAVFHSGFDLTVGNPLGFFAIGDGLDASLLLKAVDGRFGGLAADGIHEPERLDVGHHIVLLHLLKQAKQLGLRGFGLTFQRFNHEGATLLFGGEEVGLVA